jgi:hypothetical protein
MASWSLWDYVTEDQTVPIRDWYDVQDESAQAALDNAVLLLRAANDWTDPKRKEFKELHRKHAGLSEIRFWPFGRFRKFRVAGIYRPDSREFIFLVGCEKQLGLYIPRGVFDLAMKYKRDLEAGKGDLREHV